VVDCTGVGEFRWGWAGGALHVVQWGDEIVAFHELTASTHVLDVESGRLLDCLKGSASACMTTESLWINVFGDVPSSTDAESLNERLHALAGAGLVTAEHV
jgi:PqqD family protein of HPr-rel-A system